MSNLKITTFQAYLYWENPQRNLQNIALKLGGIREKTDLIVLPEMFNTSFTMNAEKFAENMDGPTIGWMREQARRFNCVVAGSIAVKEQGKFYNRFIWMRPDGSCEYYDKRHLFSPGLENRHYTPGIERKIVTLNDWRINLAVCYDLRFPVWLRNGGGDNAYDLLLLVANWPDNRSLHWKTLVTARAIENQAYVVAVNRVGHDGREIYHAGESMCIDPVGNTVYYKPEDEDLYTFSISRNHAINTREAFPVAGDRDNFHLSY